MLGRRSACAMADLHSVGRCLTPPQNPTCRDRPVGARAEGPTRPVWVGGLSGWVVSKTQTCMKPRGWRFRSFWTRHRASSCRIWPLRAARRPLGPGRRPAQRRCPGALAALGGTTVGDAVVHARVVEREAPPPATAQLPALAGSRHRRGPLAQPHERGRGGWETLGRRLRRHIRMQADRPEAPKEEGRPLATRRLARRHCGQRRRIGACPAMCGWASRKRGARTQQWGSTQQPALSAIVE